MFGLFKSDALPLVEQTSLAKFVRDASSGEKKQVYKRVLQKATEEQATVLRAAEGQATYVVGKPNRTELVGSRGKGFDVSKPPKGR